MLQIYAFVVFIKIFKSANKGVLLEKKTTEKVINIVSQLLANCDQGTNNLG